MPVPLGRAHGPFIAAHKALVGAIAFDSFDKTQFAPALLARAQAVWRQRTQSELQSAQIVSRFLSDIIAAGDPLEVYAGAALLVTDEVRHASLCANMTQAMGGALWSANDLPLSPEFLRQPPTQRALCTAIGMLAIAETVSVALIEDLAARCTHPVVGAVLRATLADEDTHGDFGWSYVCASLERFPKTARTRFAEVAHQALHEVYARAQACQPTAEQDGVEVQLTELGLFVGGREAAVALDACRSRVVPRLQALDLA